METKNYPILINGVNLVLNKIIFDGSAKDMCVRVFARNRWGEYTNYITEYNYRDELPSIAEVYKDVKSELSHLVETLEYTGVKFF